MFYIYMLESTNYGTYYIGQTNNLSSRLKRHNTGQVASTKNKHPYKIVYFEEFKTRAEAMKREREIKKKYNTERRKKLILSFDKDKLTLYLGL